MRVWFTLLAKKHLQVTISLLRLIIHYDGEIQEFVPRIKARWLKWLSVFGVLFNFRMPMKLKEIY